MSETIPGPPLPGGLSPDDEIQVNWESKPGRNKVTARLGGVTIVVKNTHEAAEIVPWLVAALPEVLEASYAQIQSEKEAQRG